MTATSFGDTTMRLATHDDRDQIFAWRNDQWLVRFTPEGRTVSREEHASWFARVIDSPDVLLFIIMSGSDDIGSLRIDRVATQRTVLTVYLLRSYTGRGIGTKAILDGSRRAFHTWPAVASIHAVIQRGNCPSIKAFTKAGYEAVPPEIERISPEELVELCLLRGSADDRT